MSNDLNNNKEKTLSIKRKHKTSFQKLFTTYFTIWLVSVLIFWVLKDGLDALLYSILFFGILMPLTTLVTSFFIGNNDCFGRRKWFFLVVSGIMYMLFEYMTFSMSNMVTCNKFNMPDFEMIVDGAMMAMVGMGIGGSVRMIRKRNSKR